MGCRFLLGDLQRVSISSEVGAEQPTECIVSVIMFLLLDLELIYLQDLATRRRGGQMVRSEQSGLRSSTSKLRKSSVEQGFQKPQGYAGKGLEGRGQGMECLTPRKPLPLSKGQGIPAVLPAGILLSNSHHPLSRVSGICRELTYTSSTNKPCYNCYNRKSVPPPPSQPSTAMTTHTPSPLPHTTIIRPPSTRLHAQPSFDRLQHDCTRQRHVTSPTDGRRQPGTSLEA
jgi:hypothetical protein